MNLPEKTPILDILHLFTAPGVPEKGPEEVAIDPIEWVPAEAEDTSMPGEGMNRYPFLYVGEGCNRIFVVADGKVIWTYDTGSGGELDDVWMLSNGNILFSRMYWCAEVSPDKKQTWYYKVPEDCEIHTLQPIGLSSVLLIQNGPTPKAIIMNKASGEIEYEHEIPYDKSLPVHTQFRRGRLTAEDTFLISYMEMGKVVEYDRDFNVLWSYNTPRPWSSQKLLNGNVLITDETELCVKEVNREGEVVWSCYASELPEVYTRGGSFDRPGAPPNAAEGQETEPIGWQTCTRLLNGNTILCSQGGFGIGPQFIEVDSDKNVVWALKNWKDLGPATHIQVLSDPGVPENPGECQR